MISPQSYRCFSRMFTRLFRVFCSSQIVKCLKAISIQKRDASRKKKSTVVCGILITITTAPLQMCAFMSSSYRGHESWFSLFINYLLCSFSLTIFLDRRLAICAGNSFIFRFRNRSKYLSLDYIVSRYLVVLIISPETLNHF